MARKGFTIDDYDNIMEEVRQRHKPTQRPDVIPSLLERVRRRKPLPKPPIRR